MAMMLLSAGPVIGAAANVKKLCDAFARLSTAPSELRYTWRLVEAIAAPLEECHALATRSEATPLVRAAVGLAQSTVEECRAILPDDEYDDLDSDDGDDEDAAEAAAGWAKWLADRKEQLRVERLRRHQELLAQAATMLALALAAVRARLPADFAASPFKYLGHAVDAAHTRMMQLEVGRAKSVPLGATAVVVVPLPPPIHHMHDRPAARRLWRAPRVHSRQLEQRAVARAMGHGRSPPRECGGRQAGGPLQRARRRRRRAARAAGARRVILAPPVLDR